MKIGFIGAGQMASALAIGIAKSELQAEILAFDPQKNAIVSLGRELKTVGGELSPCQNVQELIDKSDYVFVAVKPHVLKSALKGVTVANKQGPVFISVVAGKKIVSLATLLGTDKIVRAMPNTPCLIGQGAIGIAYSNAITIEQSTTVNSLLSQVGLAIEVPETLLDSVTGLSGSGPAFVFTFVEALIDAGVLTGLPRETSKALAIQTVLGAAQMMQHSEEHPACLRDRVTSPGGTTIHGMWELEQLGFRNSVISAVKAATNRAVELSTE